MIGDKVSNYLQYLPTMLQSDAFIGRFLLAFEQILTGEEPSNNLGIIEKEVANPPGLEAVIQQINTYLDPTKTPEEFLPWLAGWVALSIRDDWKLETKREFIKGIVPLYRLRGTKAGMEKILGIYLKSNEFSDKVTVFHNDNFPDHYFQIQLVLPKLDPSTYWRQAKIAKAIIDQEKPAHTYYGLQIRTPTMRLTGSFFSITLTQPGEIAVRVNEIKPAQSRLRISIKDFLIRAEKYALNEDINGFLEFTYQVTESQFRSNKKWYVIIDNLNISSVIINVTITYPGGSFNQENLTLEPGLKIIKVQPDGDIKKPDGTTDGNTILGTQSGNKDKY